MFSIPFNLLSVSLLSTSLLHHLYFFLSFPPSHSILSSLLPSSPLPLSPYPSAFLPSSPFSFPSFLFPLLPIYAFFFTNSRSLLHGYWIRSQQKENGTRGRLHKQDYHTDFPLKGYARIYWFILSSNITYIYFSSVNHDIITRNALKVRLSILTFLQSQLSSIQWYSISFVLYKESIQLFFFFWGW